MPYAVVRYEDGDRTQARDVLVAFESAQAADLFAVENGYADYTVAPVSVATATTPSAQRDG